MTVLPLALFAALLLEDDDLVAAKLADDGRLHRRTLDERSANRRLVAADHQHLVEADVAILGAAENVALHVERLALSDPVLLSTSTNDRVHTNLREIEPRLVTHR